VGLDLLHGADVVSEIALESCVDGRVVEGYDAGVGGGRAEGAGHRDFGAHAVAYEDWFARGELDLVLDEVLDVLGHGSVVMPGVVGRCAMVAQVDSVNWAGEFFC